MIQISLKNKLSFICLSVMFFFGCMLEENSSSIIPDSIHLVSWNVQTFFDATTTGTEYSEFIGSKSRWNQELYLQRLDKLCQAITILDADILVLQEIENQAVMYDIMNMLQEHLHGDRIYKYMCFAAEKDAAIGCGVFSRLPLKNMTTHQLDSRLYGQQPQLRPLLEVTVTATVAGNNATSEYGVDLFKLMVCHWKSKSGGQEEAVLWQSQQEKLLVSRLTQLENADGSLKIPAIICGDFNKDLSEFAKSNNCNCCVSMNGMLLKNGWLSTFDPECCGSYWYQGKWEKIDHIFTLGELDMEGFQAVKSQLWCCLDESGETIPFRYSVWQGAGFSDHLPVECFISLQ
ncbi:MAG: endonuclease/exonuclease/phosphatase family protein [Spirochaetaceae bacterium]|nr:endonuclease/exonuclease/phosphatase family protein [Spirochaetaceae bacterium]